MVYLTLSILTCKPGHRDMVLQKYKPLSEWNKIYARDYSYGCQMSISENHPDKLLCVGRYKDKWTFEHVHMKSPVFKKWLEMLSEHVDEWSLQCFTEFGECGFLCRCDEKWKQTAVSDGGNHDIQQPKEQTESSTKLNDKGEKPHEDRHKEEEEIELQQESIDLPSQDMEVADSVYDGDVEYKRDESIPAC